ncbi:hypothetical protein ABGN28_04295 [Levilactobacillus brevis]|uniref:hypothetical protein n=1 Tax=Levilactobacillus brevis TaxID=1580 RepID=UPI00325B4E2F
MTSQAVTFKAVSDDTYRQAMREAGVAPELVEVLLSMQIMMRAGELDVTSSDLADVLGRPVTPLATAIREILSR